MLVSVIAELFIYEQSDLYRSLHFNDRSDKLKERYKLSDEKQSEVDSLISHCIAQLRKRNDK